MNIAICDDEQFISEQIKKLIEKRMTDACIEMYDRGDDLLSAKKHFDIVFLDIVMDGINGIDTAKALREKKEETVIIFITGIKEYVFEAFDVAAFHYLLKPVMEEKFFRVLECAAEEVKKHHRQEPLLIRTRTRNITLMKNDILYVESRGKKVEIHTTGKNVEVYAAMNKLEKCLGDDFYRCHRGYLVNMTYIEEYGSDSITLGNGEIIYMAKEKYGDFVKTYMRFIRNGGMTNVSSVK